MYFRLSGREYLVLFYLLRNRLIEGISLYEEMFQAAEASIGVIKPCEILPTSLINEYRKRIPPDQLEAFQNKVRVSMVYWR